MKSLLLIPIVALPILLTGCETRVVERYPRRTAYVERDEVEVDRHRHHGPDVVVVNEPRHRRDVVVVDEPRRRHDVVVVETRPFYGPRADVRYYTDKRGRYYIKGGHRIYVNP